MARPARELRSVAGDLLDRPRDRQDLLAGELELVHLATVGDTRSDDLVLAAAAAPAAETALRAVISKVRSALAGLPPDLIASAFGCYRLNLQSGSLDIDDAEAALHTAETRLVRGDARAAAVDALVACSICRRPFLPGLCNAWTLAQRDRLPGLHVEARQCLAEARALLGDFTRSARAAERALDLDPYREPLYRRLIRSRALAGDRMGAAAAFARYSGLMRDELGVEPTPETVAAFNEAVAAHRA